MPVSTAELKTMAISEILEQYPQTESVFKKFGLLGYAHTETARHENLEASILVHALNLEMVLDMLMASILE